MFNIFFHTFHYIPPPSSSMRGGVRNEKTGVFLSNLRKNSIVVFFCICIDCRFFFLLSFHFSPLFYFLFFSVDDYGTSTRKKNVFQIFDVILTRPTSETMQTKEVNKKISNKKTEKTEEKREKRGGTK